MSRPGKQRQRAVVRAAWGHLSVVVSLSAQRRAHLTAYWTPTITPHDLRHTAASLGVSAGANVKALQRMLGHAKASMTLDVYADLFDEDLDSVAESLDAAIVKASSAATAAVSGGSPAPPRGLGLLPS